MGRLINNAESYSQGDWSHLAELSGFRAGNLARELGISQRQTERYIKRQFGVSPQRWLNELRMSKALHLVEKLNSVKEVAYTLGFKQVSHFCREFKQFHGVTCGEYASCLSVNRQRWGTPWRFVVWTRNGMLAALIVKRKMSPSGNKCRERDGLYRC
jgi:AraC-like DNA-binding protein